MMAQCSTAATAATAAAPAAAATVAPGRSVVTVASSSTVVAAMAAAPAAAAAVAPQPAAAAAVAPQPVDDDDDAAVEARYEAAMAADKRALKKFCSCLCCFHSSPTCRSDEQTNAQPSSAQEDEAYLYAP